MDAKELLFRLQNDMEMTEFEYKSFCRRYAERNISTVMWCLSLLYGKLPKGIDKMIRIEMCKSNIETKRNTI